MKKFLFIILAVFPPLNSCTDLDDNLRAARAEDVILKNSELKTFRRLTKDWIRFPETERSHSITVAI